MLRIMHISDLHFIYQDYDQGIVLASLLEEFRASRDAQPIDIIIFSGDLVNSGEHDIQFSEARKAFIDPTLAIYGLDVSRFFIVPGNHDISKKAVESNVWLEKGLSSDLTSLDKVNSFIDKTMSGDPSTAVAFERLENYNKFLKTLKTEVPLLSASNLQTYKVVINSVTIGVACFNSAWRCTGLENDADKGKLIIGERSIDKAIESLQGCDVTLAIFHHPTDYLMASEAEPVESRLLAGFDFLFYGHVHSTKPNIRQSPRGKAFFSQGGCLYSNRKYHNGFQIIEIDLENQIGRVLAKSYFDGPRKFRKAIDVLDENGQLSFELPIRNNTFSSVDKFLTLARSGVIPAPIEFNTLPNRAIRSS